MVYTILNLYLLILLVFSATPIRHACRPVWVNLPFAHWPVVFLDPTAAAAVIDRSIVHHATVLQHRIPTRWRVRSGNAARKIGRCGPLDRGPTPTSATCSPS